MLPLKGLTFSGLPGVLTLSICSVTGEASCKGFRKGRSVRKVSAVHTLTLKDNFFEFLVELSEVDLGELRVGDGVLDEGGVLEGTPAEDGTDVLNFGGHYF